MKLATAGIICILMLINCGLFVKTDQIEAGNTSSITEKSTDTATLDVSIEEVGATYDCFAWWQETGFLFWASLCGIVLTILMYLFTSRLIKEVRRMKKESKLLIRLRNYFSDFLADPCSSRNAYAKAYGKEDNESIKSETISVDLDMII